MRVHWVAAKHILRYLQGTMDFGLYYRQGDGVRLVGYTDSDWEGCALDMKSNFGCCFGLGLVVVSWISRKQQSVALISAESCIKLMENEFFHDRSKHIEIKYHFTRDYVQKVAIKLEYISANEQVADIFTKALPRGKHVYFRDKMSNEEHFPR
eukprot:PITA_28412